MEAHTTNSHDIYSSPEYKRSRVAYYIQCVTEYLAGLLLADAFLAKLLTHLGLSDSVIGIISSLTSLAFLVQLVTILLMQHIRNVKKFVVIVDVASMLCLMSTYWLPFLPISPGMRTAMVFVSIGGGYVLKFLVKNIYYKWGNSFVHPGGRGAFSARNEAISQVAGIVMTLIAGYLVDYYEKIGELETSFLIMACVIAVLTVIDLVMLLMIKNQDAGETARQRKPLRDVLRNTAGNRNFRNVVYMLLIYDISRYMTVGFLGTFKTQELLLTVGTVQVINIAASVLRCVLSRPAGRWADRTSFAYVFRMGLWLCALSFLFLVFTTPKNWWFIVIYTVLHNVSMAGISPNTNNMTYSYVPLDYFVQAQAIRCSISGILGFGATLIGSRILSAVQAAGNTFLGIPVYGQQVLAALSVILLLAAIAFNKFVVARQTVMKQ